MTRVTIHWALVLAAAVAANGIPIASVAQETAQETGLYYDVEDEDWREIASRVAAAEQGFDAIPAPIERSILPEVAPGAPAPVGITGGAITSEPLPEPDVAVPAEPVPPPAPIAPKVVAQPRSSLATTLLAGLRPSVVPKRKIVKATPEATLKQQLWRFYSERGGEPIWIKNGSFSEAALAVVAEISRGKDWGLNPSEFDVPVSVPVSASDEDLVDVEMKFTKAVTDYATQARSGRVDPIKISDLIDRMSIVPNAYDVLTAVTAEDAAKGLLTFHPKHPQFEKLRQAYLGLRDGKEEPARVVVVEGPKLKPGSSHPNIALLRQRLRVPAPAAAAEGDPAELYDPALVEAVKAFQKENGLRIDGIVTKQLRTVVCPKQHS
jgi:L,D-transpeptidase YcbB